MLLLNRPALARLMWARDARRGAPSAAAASPLQSALLGCLLCRRLAGHPVVAARGDGRGLALGLRRTGDEYEGLAARILEIAHGRDAERALSALEQPFAACAGSARTAHAPAPPLCPLQHARRVQSPIVRALVERD
jgi:hypothetical protein